MTAGLPLLVPSPALLQCHPALSTLLFLWDPGRHFGLRVGRLKLLFSLSAIQITTLPASTAVTFLLPYWRLRVWGDPCGKH